MLLWTGWVLAVLLAVCAGFLWVCWRRASRELAALREQPAAPAAAAPPPARRPPPVRSEALSLLAALQREARFIDLVQESLDQYTDEQVGAAARDVLRDCRTVLDRLFDLQPALPHSEGETVQVPAGFDPGRFRLTGNVEGEPPFSGRLVHHGWQANRCQVPQWSGSESATKVIAPAEVELP